MAVAPGTGVCELEAAAILHDLRSLLMIVRQHCSDLRELSPPSSAWSGQLDELQAVVERTVAVARINQGPEPGVGPPDVAQLVSELAPMIRRALPAGVQVEIEAAAGVDYRVPLDATAVARVLLNLCVNAKAAMRGDGVLSIWVDRTRLDRRTAMHPAAIGPGRFIKVTVSDSGCGVSQRELERFLTMGPSGALGSRRGLGLAIVASTLGRHGGGIRVRSQVGSGTTFELFMPVAEGAES